VGSDSYRERLRLVKELYNRIAVNVTGPTVGHLRAPPGDLMNNKIADSLLLKLVYAQTVDAILNGQ
jgi:hypothetical protein